MALPVQGNTHPITAYYSVYRPRKDERLSRPGRLVTYRNKVLPPGVEPVHVTHPSTNRARRRVTSLIQPTPLPLRHAANLLTAEVVVLMVCRSRFVEWVEGSSQHLTTEEMYHHDDNPSPQLPFDADDD